MASVLHITKGDLLCNILRGHVRAIYTTCPLDRSSKVNLFDLNFDRRVKIDHLESIKYLDSNTYKEIYKGNKVWELFRRNHKAQFPRENTRPNCVNQEGFLSTSYPCPICRDEYLVLHHDNVKLLQQFIDPHTGNIMQRRNHHLCLKQYRNLIIAIHKARDLGTLTYQVPDRLYDYKEYYDQAA